jgi:hypothetical protein
MDWRAWRWYRRLEDLISDGRVVESMSGLMASPWADKARRSVVTNSRGIIIAGILWVPSKPGVSANSNGADHLHVKYGWELWLPI